MDDAGRPPAGRFLRGLAFCVAAFALDVLGQPVAPPPAHTGPERGFRGETVTRSATQARRSFVDAEVPGARLDFTFNAGETRVWLYRDGEWQVRGELWHRAWRCVRYDIAIRFGVGTEGCTDVRWLGSPVSIHSDRQCHQTKTPYASGERQPLLAAEFGNVTCAERVVRRQDD